MSATYNSNTLVLKNLTVSIESGKKLGNCGRTRQREIFTAPQSNTPRRNRVRDHLDRQLGPASPPRNNIHSRLITVPQDPMLVMTDTVRQNLDIAGSAIYDEDIRVLKRVKLCVVRDPIPNKRRKRQQ